MKRLLIIILACYSLSVEAQVNESSNFVYLYSDSVIYAKNIRLRSNFFNSKQLRVDSKPMSLKQVKFFKNDEGFFANTSRFNALSTKVLSERVIEGRINLFEERTYHTFFSGGPYMHHNSHVVDTRMFYNKGYDDLKKVNYKNLKLDMADDVESLDLLKGYKRSMNTSTSLYVAAGASAAAALISFFVNTKDEQKSFNGDHLSGPSPSLNEKRTNLTASFVLLGIGGGFATGGYFVKASGLRKLEGAVDSYNR